jgi:hypothetical protein
MADKIIFKMMRLGETGSFWNLMEEFFTPTSSLLEAWLK